MSVLISLKLDPAVVPGTIAGILCTKSRAGLLILEIAPGFFHNLDLDGNVSERIT
jgi:hypothetical protein